MLAVVCLQLEKSPGWGSGRNSLLGVVEQVLQAEVLCCQHLKPLACPPAPVTLGR